MPSLGEVRARYREKALGERINPRDVDLLLADCCERTISQVIAHDDDAISESELDRFAQQFRRRIAGEPLQYIRGRCEFYGREFLVDSRVLIPRPETELLVELALDRSPQNAAVLDVGTGSGCIAVTIAAERTDLRVTAVDRSFDTLRVATTNRERHAARVRFFSGDALRATRGLFDLIVSNPPYVGEDELESLEREVRHFEPRMALTPGKDALAVIRELLRESGNRLVPRGLLMMEIGYGQSERVRDLATESGWSEVDIHRDLAGIDRVVVLSRTRF